MPGNYVPWFRLISTMLEVPWGIFFPQIPMVRVQEMSVGFFRRLNCIQKISQSDHIIHFAVMLVIG